MKSRRGKRRIYLTALLLVGPWLHPARAQFLGPAFRVNTYTTGNQHLPAVASNGDGNFVVVWQDGGMYSDGQDGSSYGIFGQRFNSAGSKVGSEFQVNAFTTGSQNRPAVAADSLGNFVVTWSGSGQSDSSGIFGQRFSSAGNPAGSEFRLNTYTTGNQAEPAVVADGLGNFVVIWSGTGQSDSDGIFGQRLDSGGNLVGSEFRVNTHIAGDQGAAAVASNGPGNFVVVWTDGAWNSNGQDGSSYGIFGQRFNSAGSKVGSEFQANTYTTGWQRDPAVAAAGLGNFVVTWSVTGQDDSDGIFGQRFNSVGLPAGGEFRLNTVVAYTALQPAVAADGSGNFFAVWGSGRDYPPYLGVFGNWLPSAGSPAGSEFLVGTDTPTFTLGPPAVTADSSGNFLVTWPSDPLGQDDSLDVYARRVESSIIGCAADGDTLCLNNSRFRVEVSWRNYSGQTGSGHAVDFRNDSGLFWFFGPSNLEMLIKVINGCGLNQRYWVYAAATTDVEYQLTVTDSVTGLSRQYFNALGNRAAAITDSSAFATCGSPLDYDPSLESALDDIEMFAESVDEASDDVASLESTLDPESTEALCTPGNNDLCLGNNRFRVRIAWRDYNSHTGSGWAVPYANDSGMFWFFSADNIEFLVKVIDGCGLNSRYWVYAAATTDVEYTMTVTDTLMNVTKTYTNPLGTASPAITDSSAFATCSTPATIVGTWRGTVTQPGFSYTTTIVANTAQNGTIEYGSPASCSGTLSGPGGPGPVFTFTESITHGGCVDNGTVTATVTGNTLAFLWTGFGATATGTLTRQ